MKIVIDTNIFVSSLDEKDIFYSECYPIFEKLLDSEIEAICPLIILVETICAIRRRINNTDITFEIYKNLIDLPSIKWLEITMDMAGQVCLWGNKTGLKGGDAIILHVAHSYNIPLLTMDKEIKIKAPKDILIYTPVDIKV